jgi:hypothetical protein
MSQPWWTGIEGPGGGGRVSNPQETSAHPAGLIVDHSLVIINEVTMLIVNGTDVRNHYLSLVGRHYYLIAGLSNH